MSFTGFQDPNNPTPNEIAALTSDLYARAEWHDYGHGWYHGQAAIALEALNTFTPASAPQQEPEPEPPPPPPPVDESWELPADEPPLSEEEIEHAAEGRPPHPRPHKPRRGRR